MASAATASSSGPSGGRSISPLATRRTAVPSGAATVAVPMATNVPAAETYPELGSSLANPAGARKTALEPGMAGFPCRNGEYAPLDNDRHVGPRIQRLRRGCHQFLTLRTGCGQPPYVRVRESRRARRQERQRPPRPTDVHAHAARPSSAQHCLPPP